MRHVVQLALIAAAAAGAACSVSMPDQDRRIYTATPVAKLSVADLWKDFHDDASQASARYVGKAIDISGSASAVGTADTTKSTTLLFP